MVMLDNAATSVKPRKVLDAQYKFMIDFGSSNIHRGNCILSLAASDIFENSRVYIQKFINAASPREIVFNSGATAGLNFLAQTLCKSIDDPKKNVIAITESGHTSAVVPFQKFCIESKKKVFFWIPILKSGLLDYQALEDFLKKHGKNVFLLVIEQMNNALGTINEIDRVISLCKQYGIITIIDGCQSLPHMDIDVQKMGCDFFVFSSHKAFGSFGSGAIYCKESILSKLLPVTFGGGGVYEVSLDDTELSEYPERFEVGTQNLSGVHMMELGLRFLSENKKNGAFEYEHKLYMRLVEGISRLPKFRIIGMPLKSSSIVSIVHESKTPKEVSKILSNNGLCIRDGLHCTHTIMKKLNLPGGTCRLSLSFLNTEQEIDYTLSVLQTV